MALRSRLPSNKINEVTLGFYKELVKSISSLESQANSAENNHSKVEKLIKKEVLESFSKKNNLKNKKIISKDSDSSSLSDIDEFENDNNIDDKNEESIALHLNLEELTELKDAYQVELKAYESVSESANETLAILKKIKKDKESSIATSESSVSNASETSVASGTNPKEHKNSVEKESAGRKKRRGAASNSDNDNIHSNSHFGNHHGTNTSSTVKEEKQSTHSTASSHTDSMSSSISSRRKNRGASRVSPDVSPQELTIQIGSEVAFKHRKIGDWIQCIITRKYAETSKYRYEVTDPEPDETVIGSVPQTFKAMYKDVILIPPANSNLSPYPPGTLVLARYPETTTFYPGEVVGTKKNGSCRIRFEGEEEENKETEVERRFVLQMP